MPVTYINKGNKIYFLHHEKTKTGKPRYYFSMKDEGNLMEKIPLRKDKYHHDLVITSRLNLAGEAKRNRRSVAGDGWPTVLTVLSKKTALIVGSHRSASSPSESNQDPRR